MNTFEEWANSWIDLDLLDDGAAWSTKDMRRAYNAAAREAAREMRSEAAKLAESHLRWQLRPEKTFATIHDLPLPGDE